jgi:hypothetical protein
MKSSAVDDTPEGSRARIASSAALIVVLAAPAILFWAWSRPTAAPPLEMPPLALAPEEVAAQIEADADAAQRQPEGEDVDARERLYREHNAAEVGGGEPAARASQRTTELLSLVRRIRRAHGAAAVQAMRAADLAAFEEALGAETEDRDEVVGGFVRMMQRYGLVSGARQIAPRIVVRSLFKARWSSAHGLPLTDGLSRIERQSYWGWLALRAETAPLERRLEATEQFAAAGGARANEARAVLLFDDGQLDEARAAFEAARAESPTYRLRNHALACAGLDEEGDAP